MPNKFILRVATPADVPEIEKTIAASVRQLQAPDYTARQREGALATVFTVDNQLIADGTYFIALAHTGDDTCEVAGCGGWSYRKTLYGGHAQLERTEPEVLNPATDAAKVRAIFVSPRFARQGLGSLLLEAAENAAMAAGFRRFEMGSTLTGIALYSLKGYRETGRILVPVSGEEAIEVVRMEKSAKFNAATLNKIR
jgi:GNAT superfamily N-acetyltransferase